jgi:putative component of membrane protein insertase Oxa1/YidC/SpoIIIJ protein YidD
MLRRAARRRAAVSTPRRKDKHCPEAQSLEKFCRSATSVHTACCVEFTSPLRPRLLATIAIFAVFLVPPADAQIRQIDLSLVASTRYSETAFDERKIVWMRPAKGSLLWEYNPLSLAFATLLFLYQAEVSPQLALNCPHSPTCSEFARQAIEQCGLPQGLLLAADRLLRCNQCGISEISDNHRDSQSGRVLDPIKDYE